MTAARKLHGDLADDIELLASDGKVIRRHDGMYRLNGATEKLTPATASSPTPTSAATGCATTARSAAPTSTTP